MKKRLQQQVSHSELKPELVVGRELAVRVWSRGQARADVPGRGHLLSRGAVCHLLPILGWQRQRSPVVDLEAALCPEPWAQYKVESSEMIIIRLSSGVPCSEPCLNAWGVLWNTQALRVLIRLTLWEGDVFIFGWIAVKTERIYFYR